MASDRERSRRRVQRTKSDDALDTRTDTRRIMMEQRADSLKNVAGSTVRAVRRSSRKQVDDYDVALAKVRDRFNSSGGKNSESKLDERSENKKSKGRGAQSRLGSVPKNYEDALAKVAARFSLSGIKNGVSRKAAEGRDEARGDNKSRDVLPSDYENASRFSATASRSSGKESKRRSSKKKGEHVPMSHADALAKVAARYADGSKGPIRRGSRRHLDVNADKDYDDCDEKAILTAAGSLGGDGKEQQKVRPRLTKQQSFDSTDEDRAIAEAVSEEVTTHKRASHKDGAMIDDPTRRVERRGSDSTVDTSSCKSQEKRKERGRGLRRTTSDELRQFELAEIAERDERVRESRSPMGRRRSSRRKSKVKKSVAFREDPDAKHGVYCRFLEGSSPLTPEEKCAAWYGGRNYKLFKSLCYSESVEAKENQDYCMRFDKVWAACATVSVDFAWQELMKAEHKKASPNNAVMLAKARCRGFEREIFPETLLRNRLASVKYVTRSFRQARASLTMSQDERDESVRDASIRCSRPFRRFARLIAEGDSLLVAAWERVKRQDPANFAEEGRDDGGYMGGSRRDLMSSAKHSDRRGSRRDLMYSMKSSGSARKLMSQGGSRRNLLSSGGHQESRRNMMMSLKSSGSCRKMLSRMPDDNREHSRRDLMSSLQSSGSSRKLMKQVDGQENEKPRRRTSRRSSRKSLRISPHAA